VTGRAQNKTAAILGATGLVGEACLRLLLANDTYAHVRVLVRRTPPELPSSVRLEVETVEVDRPETYAHLLEVDHLYCALGTTIKKARTREAFRRVDLEIPLRAARIARERGAVHFLLVSALGASANSRVFYSRVKGELEEALRGLGYPALTIVRPSLLLGARRERRPAEGLVALATPLIPRRWRPVPASAVAEALLDSGREDQGGVHVIENLELHRRKELLR
jgi:uncharacterized protein YbjT (DUF2867 family)